MLESKAKTKWCPFAGAINKGCIGSACMAWEPEHELQEAETPHDEPPPTSDISDEIIVWAKNIISTKHGPDGEKITVWHRYIPTDKGDCGLKSKPLECGQ